MGRLGVASLGLRGGLIGGVGTGIYYEAPLEGFFYNEMDYIGSHKNELYFYGEFIMEEIISDYDNELDFVGDFELETEYEGYHG